MKLFLYSIYDRLLGVHLTPFPARADVEAQRQVLNSMRDPNMASTPIVTNPGDYDLVYVGVFDDEAGKLLDEPHKSGRQGPVVLNNLRALLPADQASRTPAPSEAPRFPGLDDPGVD